VIFSFRVGTRSETEIRSPKNPKKDLAAVDSPNNFFKDVKRCQQMSKGFAALCHIYLTLLDSLDSGKPFGHLSTSFDIFE
jgi:hypothetical protein